jgi:hypothetical protein
MRASRPLVTTVIAVAPIFPPKAQLLPESKRRLKGELFGSPTTADFRRDKLARILSELPVGPANLDGPASNSQWEPEGSSHRR